MTLFEAPTGGAFDRLNWQHNGVYLTKIFQKSEMPRGGGVAWAVLELTGTLQYNTKQFTVDPQNVNLNFFPRRSRGKH